MKPENLTGYLSRRAFLQSVAAVGASVGLAACAPAVTAPTAGGEAPAAAEESGTAGLAAEQVLVLQQDAEPTEGLDPAWIGGWWRMTSLAQALYSALYFVDYTNTPRPDLADSYEVSDDSRVWTFHIARMPNSTMAHPSPPRMPTSRSCVRSRR